MADGEAGRLWEVVGGADKGGIVVRTGAALSSPEADSRLSTGAVVQELECTDAGRLHYRLVRGLGPDSGWVSLKLKDKALLVPADDAAASAASAGDGAPSAGSRKVRVLCLHGTAGSPGVFSRQLSQLIRAAEPDIEFFFHGGHLRCTEEDPTIGKQVTLVQQFFPNEVLTQYALPTGGGKKDGNLDEPDTWRSYEGLDEAMDLIQASLRQQAPIDAVLGFSQGSNLASIVAAQSCLGRGARIRCVLHLCSSLPGWTREGGWSELFETPLDIPALVVRGAKDNVAHGSSQVAALYGAAEERAHEADHRPLPSNPKECQEFVAVLKDFLLRHCRAA